MTSDHDTATTPVGVALKATGGTGLLGLLLLATGRNTAASLGAPPDQAAGHGRPTNRGTT